jgi:hypothetical protein
MRLIVLMLIVTAGLGLRLDAAWKGSEENLPDSAAYERIARGLEQRGKFEQVGPGIPPAAQQASNYSPGLPLLVGGIFELSGNDDVRLARILLAIIGAISIPLTYLLGVRIRGVAAGLAGAAMLAFYPTLIGDAGMLLTEPLAGTLIVGAVLLLLRARETGRLRSWIPPGLLLGLTAMVRPEYLAITALLGFVILVAGIRRGGTRPALPAAVLVLSALLVVAPWTARNFAEMGRLVPISTGAGQTVFSGSYVPSGGDPQKVTPALLKEDPSLASLVESRAGTEAASAPPDLVFRLMANREYPGVPTDEALSRMGRQQYVEDLRRDPIGFTAFLAAKAHRIWWHGRAGLTSHTPGKLLHWLIAALSLVGLAVLARTRPYEFRILALLLVAATAIGVMFVASPRRALALWPVVSSLSGVGLVAAASVLVRRPENRKRTVVIP